MGSLINSIPVYKPQQAPQNPIPAVSVSSHSAPSNRLLSDIINKYPQDKIYTYVPAEPLSPARTKPVGVSARKPSGELIKENFFQSVGRTVKSYGDYAKYFYNAAFKGEGKDYTVGKINDLSIRAGSLGIATVLAASKIFPFARGMEFVGLATWFASMAVWPKILGAPIKALYGVDINQKYKNSDGMIKDVFEDNQYRPMDIYRYADKNGKPLTKEEYFKKYDHEYVYLEKIGDKLGLDKDIKNRNEATMNKMGQVAVQGRTLWMMTAGVMTPVVSSIVADAAQKPLKDAIEKTRYTKNENILIKLESNVRELLGEKGNVKVTDIDKIYEKLDLKVSPNVEHRFNSLLSENGELTQAQFNELNRFFEKRFYGTGYYDSVRAAMSKDSKMTEPVINLTEELKNKLVEISRQSFEEVINALPESYKRQIPEKISNYAGMSENEIKALFDDMFVQGNVRLNLQQSIALKDRMPAYAIARFEEVKGRNPFLVKLVSNARIKMNEKLNALYESEKRYIVSADEMKKLFRFGELNRQLKGRLSLFERATIKNISEAATAVAWERVPQEYLKALGFSNKELAALAISDSSFASKIITKRFEAIASKPEEYQKVIKTMSEFAKKAVSKEEKAVIRLIGTIDNPGVLIKVKELMESVAQANFGHNMQETITASYMQKIRNVQRKMRNTVDSFVRPIKALDLFHRIDDAVSWVVGAAEEGRGGFAERKNNPAYHMFENMSYAKARKSVNRYLKDIILQKNDINNWTTKMEHDLPGAKRGLKYSKDVLCTVADVIFEELHPDTVRAIRGEIPEKFAANEDFITKINANNRVMKAKFLRIKNELTKEDTLVMQSLGDIVEILKNGSPNAKEARVKAAKLLQEIIKDKLTDVRSNWDLNELKNYKTVLDDFITNKAYSIMPNGEKYGIQGAIDLLTKKGSMTEFWSSNKAISESTGKNITDFLSSAAQNVRARNKWTKLVYGLLFGTLAVSAVTIARMGRTNIFNTDKYEYKNKAEGADR